MSGKRLPTAQRKHLNNHNKIELRILQEYFGYILLTNMNVSLLKLKVTSELFSATGYHLYGKWEAWPNFPQ